LNSTSRSKIQKPLKSKELGGFLLSIGQFKIRIKKSFIFPLQYHEIWSFIMQKPVKRGDAWRITVRYLRKRYTATRDTASECEQWAAKKLLELQF